MPVNASRPELGGWACHWTTKRRYVYLGTVTGFSPDHLARDMIPAAGVGLRRCARLRSGRVGLAGCRVGDHLLAVRSETRPATAE